MPSIVVQAAFPTEIKEKLQDLENDFKDGDLTKKGYCRKTWKLIKRHVSLAFAEKVHALQMKFGSFDLSENDYCEQLISLLKSSNSSSGVSVEESKPKVNKKLKFDGTPRAQKTQIEGKNASPLKSDSSPVVRGQQGHGLPSSKQGNKQKQQKNKDQHTNSETPPKIGNVEKEQQNQQQQSHWGPAEGQNNDSELSPQKGDLQKQQQGNQNQQVDALSPEQGNRRKWQQQNKQQGNQNQQKKWEPQQSLNEEEKFFLSWTDEEHWQLLTHGCEAIKNTNEENYVKALKKTDWSEISIGEHSAEDCQKTWNILDCKSNSPRVLCKGIRMMLLGTQQVNIAQVPENDSQDQQEAAEDQQECDSAVIHRKRRSSTVTNATEHDVSCVSLERPLMNVSDSVLNSAIMNERTSTYSSESCVGGESSSMYESDEERPKFEFEKVYLNFLKSKCKTLSRKRKREIESDVLKLVNKFSIH